MPAPPKNVRATNPMRKMIGSTEVPAEAAGDSADDPIVARTVEAARPLGDGFFLACRGARIVLFAGPLGSSLCSSSFIFIVSAIGVSNRFQD